MLYAIYWDDEACEFVLKSFETVKCLESALSHGLLGEQATNERNQTRVYEGVDKREIENCDKFELSGLSKGQILVIQGDIREFTACFAQVSYYIK